MSETTEHRNFISRGTLTIKAYKTVLPLLLCLTLACIVYEINISAVLRVTPLDKSMLAYYFVPSVFASLLFLGIYTETPQVPRPTYPYEFIKASLLYVYVDVFYVIVMLTLIVQIHSDFTVSFGTVMLNGGYCYLKSTIMLNTRTVYHG